MLASCRLPRVHRSVAAGALLCAVMLLAPTAAWAQASIPPPATAAASPSASPVPSTAVVPATPDAGGAPGPLLWLLMVVVVVTATIVLFRWAFAAQATGRAGRVLGTLITLYILGLFSTPFLGLPGNGWLVLDFVALGVSLGAGFFGFLFGLPQTVRSQTVAPAPANGAGSSPNANHGTVVSTSTSSQDADGTLRPSTNLETVAEQLTKYATGAAFASIAATAAYVGDFGAFVRHAVNTDAAPVLGGMILIAYSSLGFVISYVVTRTDLSESFRDADDRVLHRGGELFNAVLPDVGDAATDEQKALAKQIIKWPFERLTAEYQRLAWARAQVIVGDETRARIAYASLYATNPTDPDVVVEFATALYDDGAFSDNQFILNLIDQAKELVDDDDLERQARIAALTAATYLYVSGGYPDTILTVNDALKRGISPSMTFRFHRACAFGQMYRAYKDKQRLTREDDAEITNRITTDTAITFTLGAAYRGLFRDIVAPAPGSEEDDLQAFAFDHPEYVKQFGFPAPTQYPDPRSDGEPVLVAPLPGPSTPAEMAKNAPP